MLVTTARTRVHTGLAMHPPSSPKSNPPCPSCKSENTIETAQHFGERLYFCVACQASWSSIDGPMNKKSNKQTT